jgi:hypothetical protein
MRLLFLVFMAALLCGAPAQAATGRILKVLPHYLDKEGRTALSPSLFERDAYQAKLRAAPKLRGGLRFSVQWKTRQVTEPVTVKVELRGTAEAAYPKMLEIEGLVQPAGFFNKWTELDLRGQDYKDFGEVTAWRVTLWRAEELLAEQKSFLW